MNLKFYKSTKILYMTSFELISFMKTFRHFALKDLRERLIQDVVYKATFDYDEVQYR